MKRGDKPSEDLWLWSRTRLKSPAKTPAGIWSDSINWKRQTAAETYHFWKMSLAAVKANQISSGPALGPSLPQTNHINHTNQSHHHQSSSANLISGVLKYSLDVSHHPPLLPEGLSRDVRCPVPVSWCSVMNSRRRQLATPQGGAAPSCYYRQQHLVEIKQPCQR